MVFGFSIHAKRRIEVFAQDPRFDVAVISNYGYEIPKAEVFLLPSGTPSESAIIQNSLSLRIKKILDRPHKGLLQRIGLFILNQGSAVVSELINSFQDIRAIKRIIRECKPDLIFLQTLLYPSYLVFFLKMKIPIMITFWNGDVIWWAKYTFFENLFKKQIVQRGVIHANAITVNSSSAFDACRSLGKDASDIHLIRYPGVDLSTFQSGDREEARKRLQIYSDKVILWPRGAGYYHNLNTLLRAVPELVNRYPDILFILLQVIQDGDILSKDIREWIEIHPRFQKNLLCLGNIPHHLMPEYYRASNMMLSLSSYDSLPNCMLEAMACGIPLIMGDIPQIQEWVINGQNGFLVPVDSESSLAEKIIQVIEDMNQDNTRFIQSNRQLIEREFDSRIIKERIRNLVLHIVSKSN